MESTKETIENVFPEEIYDLDPNQENISLDEKHEPDPIQENAALDENHDPDPSKETALELVPVVLSSLSLDKSGQGGSSTSSEESDNRDDLLHALILNNDEYDESTTADDEDSDFEADFEVPSGSDSQKSEENVVFEHTLKPSLFFETIRDRRRRHLENRLRGTVPLLKFTGSQRTEFWGHYGVEPTKHTPVGSVKSNRTMLSDEEFKKLGPMERRIHVNGQKFKIVANSDITDSLYRTIAQAVGMLESEYTVVHEAILYEVAKQWPIFCTDVCDCIGKILKDSEAQLLNPKRMVEKYRKQSEEKSYPPYFELIAAALHFGFSFSIIEFATLEQPVSVKNCTNDRVLMKATAKYHFLKTGKNYPYYEFLLPIGPLKKIQDGLYQTVIHDVILVETYRPWIDTVGKPKYRPAIGSVPVGFALDHRIYLHRTTVSHDLWSLLAELIFRKLIHAPQIKRRIIDSKHDFALYYLACKAKKRYQVRGNASIEKLADDFSQRFSKEYPRGDIEDLVQAAIYFDFSYTVIGLDSYGNFFWRDYVSKHEANKKHGPYLAFFVKTMPDKMMFWYALEDIGRSCPKEKKLYQDVQYGDLRKWGGRFYFHNVPVKVSSFIHKQRSSKILTKVPTRMLSDASKWASSNFVRLRSTLTATISFVSLRTKNVFQSIFSFFSSFRKRRHKVYPDKNVQALFVREQP